MTETKKIKPLSKPGYTMFNNYTIDYFMPRLSANGWKVLCVAIRQTWGWADETSETGRKEKDRIAYSQFMNMTGIKSTATLSKAIKENLDKGYLLRGKNPTHAQMFDYCLNMDYEIEVGTTSESEAVSQEETASENEQVEQETPLDSKEEQDKTSLEIKDTKETLSKETPNVKKEDIPDFPEKPKEQTVKIRPHYEKGEPHIVVPDEIDQAAIEHIIRQTETHRDQFDLALDTENAPANFSLPPSAGGSDAAAEAALAAMYGALDSEPAKQGSGAWKQAIENIGQVLRDYGVTGLKVAGEAGKAFGKANVETPHFVNPQLATFPAAFGIYVGKAKKQAIAAANRQTRDLAHAEASQAALAERLSARGPPVEDCAVGQAVKNELQLQMSKPAFDTYVKPASIIQHDGVVLVTAPDEFGRDWLENRIAKTIRRTAVGVLGKAVKIQFEVAE